MRKSWSSIKSKLTFFIVIVIATFVGGAMTTIVRASIPDSNGTVHGCYSTARGSLYIIDDSSQSCASGETSLTWDQHGTSAGNRFGDLMPSSFTNRTSNQTDFSFRNMSHGNFTNSDLSGSNFNYANFSNANFSGAHASVTANDVDFTNANFHGADLNSAGLASANFTDADLSDSTLTGAIFNGSNFTDANLTNADLSNVGFADATGLNTATLSGVTWSNTTCPDETNSNDHSNTCAGHLTP